MTIITRRDLVRMGLAVGAASSVSAVEGISRRAWAQSAQAQSRQRVAAIQFAPALGQVEQNLGRVDAMVRDAFSKGAKWVVLPEFFTSGAHLHPAVFDSYLPFDGKPMQLLKQLAAAGNAYVWGSFLAKAGGDGFNMGVLACPDGTVFTHDKDFPTMILESSIYAGGEDAAYVEKVTQDGGKTAGTKIPGRAGNSTSGVFAHGGTKIGTALCWELVRNRTAQRLKGNVDILMASSGWWTADPEFGWGGGTPTKTAWNEHYVLIDTSPRRMARMIGAPIVHANFTGPNIGYTSTNFDKEGKGRYLGRSQIVDAQGKTVAQFGSEEGVLIAEVTLGAQTPAEAIPGDFWFPEVSNSMRQRWSQGGAEGRNYYLNTTRARLR